MRRPAPPSSPRIRGAFDIRPEDSRTHVFRYRPECPAEREILEPLVEPGTRALDVGTAATGRSALLLRALGATVVSVDFNHRATLEFARSGSADGIGLATADLCALPFGDGQFDLVLVAFHGLDYVLDEAGRRAAFAEAHRVLRPGGSLVFNGFNRLGLILSPDYLGVPKLRRLRARYLLRLGFLRRTLIDAGGLELYQATPGETIRAGEAAGFRFRFATDLAGRSRSLTRVALFATEPYYLFERR